MNKNNSRDYETFDRRSRDTRSFLACQVLSYNEDNCSVSVVPAYRERVLDQQGRTISHEDMGEIIDVPVSQIAGIRWIPRTGEHGSLIFHDVSIDDYIDSGNITDLDEISRFHDYTDAVYLPFDFRCENASNPLIEIRNGSVRVLGDLTVDGDVRISGESYLNHEHLETGLKTQGHTT